MHTKMYQTSLNLNHKGCWSTKKLSLCNCIRINTIFNNVVWKLTQTIFICSYMEYICQLIWYSRACGSYQDIDRESLLIKIYLRERPFNLKGGYGFFLKKYSDSQCCWKKYSDFGGEKKKIIWFRVFVIKNFALCATKKINILTLVLSEKKILIETKHHTPPPPPSS
jgi:hypothetical protein